MYRISFGCWVVWCPNSTECCRPGGGHLADAVAGVRVHLVIHHAGVPPHHVHQPAEQLPHEAIPQHLRAVGVLDLRCKNGYIAS